jgi:hypothetical protein
MLYPFTNGVVVKVGVIPRRGFGLCATVKETPPDWLSDGSILLINPLYEE